MRQASLNRNFVVGLLFGLVAAASFGASGPLAKGLLSAGWSANAAVTWRVTIGALVLLPFGLLALRGRWHTLRRGWKRVVMFGFVSVAVVQLAFFLSIQTLPVAVALLIEYLGIVMVVGWLWLRRGERPRPLTIAGSVLSMVGLVLVLDVFGAQTVDPVGALWALLAAVGLASYFLISAETGDGLPGLTLASTGLLVGAMVLALAGLLGVAPLHWNTQPVELAGRMVPWWVDVAALGLVAAALAYSTGILASRRLGSKLASFVGLSEVLLAVVWAVLLLGEKPTPIQLLGGSLIFVGVVLVKLDEAPPEKAAA
ncbi:MAG: DMT family transporter [Trueperaceae bacterium]